jgi:hypothetical protein
LLTVFSNGDLNSPSKINGVALQAKPFALTILHLRLTPGHFFATLGGLG